LQKVPRGGFLLCNHDEAKKEPLLYQTLLTDSKLYESLRELDEEIAAEWKEGDCGFCGEILHWARYRRQPRGGPMESKTPYQFRLSFCCALCRLRTTPPSVLFTEGVFRCGGGIGMRAAAWGGGDGGFEAPGVNGCEPTNIAPMAEVVEGGFRPEQVLGVGTGPSEASGGGGKASSITAGLL
jgi:hypothetical protein